MKYKIYLLAAALLMPLAAQAQWRVGTYMGATYNDFSMDKQYMSDFQIDGRWGTAMGVFGQYNINEWLGVRADLNLMQKNHRQHRSALKAVDYRFRNTYLQLPLMASFSFGGRELRGFCNLGVYGGYWLDEWLDGTDYYYYTNSSVPVAESMSFNAERDQRWDFGFIGGVGMEYMFAHNWSVRTEVNCYYSIVSTTKQYMRVKDYRYNTTALIQLGIVYSF